MIRVDGLTCFSKASNLWLFSHKIQFGVCLILLPLERNVTFLYVSHKNDNSYLNCGKDFWTCSIKKFVRLVALSRFSVNIGLQVSTKWRLFALPLSIFVIFIFTLLEIRSNYGFVHDKQVLYHWATSLAHFLLFIFSQSLGGDPPASASWVAEITSLHYHGQITVIYQYGKRFRFPIHCQASMKLLVSWNKLSFLKLEVVVSKFKTA